MTGLRFFTVYGPWGRPDMSAWIFTDAILKDQAINVYNSGQMRRDFTYIDDIVVGILAALDRVPGYDLDRSHAIYNLGNSASEELNRFIEVIEKACGRQAKRNMEPMQPGDVKATWADIETSRRDLGFDPMITIDEGIPRFVEWFKNYHRL